MKSMFLILIIFIYLLFSKCTSVNDVSDSDGGGTKTGNPVVITGFVTSLEGKPVVNAKVTVHESNYLHSTTESPIESSQFHSVTNDSGKFLIQVKDSGEYSIEVSDTIANAVLLQCTVDYSNSQIDLGTYTLRPFAKINGTFSDIKHNQKYYVQIYGIERITEIDSSGNFKFNNLPAGTYSLRIITNNMDTVISHYESISVESDISVNLPFSEWKFSKQIILNTSNSGTHIETDLYHFPVLVRLSAKDINFAECNDSGFDLRFRKADGTVLPFEIEKWDISRKIADIWVSVDTIYGNNVNQFFVIHWGNPLAKQDQSAFPFDSTHGFLGVWHLGKSVNDATPFKRTTTTSGTYDTMGMIGNARKFNENEFIKIDGLMDKPSSLTLSAWVNLETSGGNGAEIVSIGDAAFIRQDDTSSNHGTMGSYSSDSVINSNHTRHDNVYSNKFYAKTGWHYLAYTIDSKKGIHTLYIDGEYVNAKSNQSPIFYNDLGTNTFIGQNGFDQIVRDFTGLIDEVEISGNARSADWIKLSFENQKTTNNFIQLQNKRKLTKIVLQ